MTGSTDPRLRLIQLFREKSLRIGRFVLTSGMTSFYYFDSKPTTLDPEGAALSARLILEAISSQGIEAQAIGGMTLGADPIVAAVAACSWMWRDEFRPLSAFIVRRDAKKHGTQRFIEGFQGEAGTPVVIIDDVCTTGGSTLESIRKAEEAGLKVAAVFCLVDREQGGGEKLGAYPFHALLTARELLDTPEIQAEIAGLRSEPSS